MLHVLTLLSALGAGELRATTYVADGVDADDAAASTRFYDCGKGYYWGSVYSTVKPLYTESGSWSFLGDLADKIDTSYTASSLYDYRSALKPLMSDMYSCWTQVTSNLLQYWESYYGVFYRDSATLPYGYTYDPSLCSATGGTQSLSISQYFYERWDDVAGNLDWALQWYFRGSAASYGSSGPLSDSDAFFAEYFAGGSPCTFYENIRNVGTLQNYLSTALGKSTGVKGQLAYLGLSTASGSGHALTCYGWETDANGTLTALLLTNSDDSQYSLFRLYPKADSQKRLYLYTDADCTTLWKYASVSWYLSDVAYINTPKLLQSMYAAYSASSTALEWSGGAETWRADMAPEDTTRLPSASDGWQVSLSGTAYASYYDAERPVSFNDGASSYCVAISGAVSTPKLVLANSSHAYTFTGGSVAADAVSINGSGSATWSGAALTVNSALSYTGYTLRLTDGAALTAPSVTLGQGAELELEGACSLSGSLTLTNGASLVFVGTSGTPTTLEGSLTLGSGSLLSFNPNGATEASSYAVLSISGDFSGDLSASSTAEISYTYADHLLTVHVAEGMAYDACGKPVSLFWSGADAVWSADSGSWKNDKSYTSGQAVMFACGGSVELVGELTPGHVAVAGSEEVSFTGSGSLGGSGSLCKSGSGTLHLATANTYSGGTKLLAGTLSAENAAALGSGAVTVSGGCLNLNDSAVTNAVSATGGTLSGMSAYAGALTLNGAVTLEGALSADSLTLAGGSLNLTDSVTVGSLTVSGATSLTLGDYEPGTYALVTAGSCSGDLSLLTAVGYDADYCSFSYSDGALVFTVLSDAVSLPTCTNGDHCHLSDLTWTLTHSVNLPELLYWDTPTGKGTHTLTGAYRIEGEGILCIGKSYLDAKRTFTTGKAVYTIEDSVLWRADSLTAGYGATVHMQAAVNSGELGVLQGGTLYLEGAVSEAVTLSWSGGTIRSDAARTVSELKLHVDNKTAQNLYVGDLTVADGGCITVDYTARSSKALLAVQGVLTLGSGVSLSLDTTGGTKAMAEHAFVVLQALGIRGAIDSVTLQPEWGGTLCRAVYKNADLLIWQPTDTRKKYTKPKTLTGPHVVFTEQLAGASVVDSNIQAGDYSASIAWSTTKSKQSYTLSGSASLTGELLSATGRSTYTIGEDIALEVGEIAAVKGAQIVLSGSSVAADTLLSVAAGSTTTTCLDVADAALEGPVRLSYAGGTMRGSATASALSAAFNSTVKKQNLWDGSLTLAAGATVTVDAQTRITRPVLAVTGSLTLAGAVTVEVQLGDKVKQGDFILFESRALAGAEHVSVSGENLFEGSVVQVTSGAYQLLCYVADSTRVKLKAVKIAADSTLPSVSAAALSLGESGGSLLSGVYSLDETAYDCETLQALSGITEVAAGTTVGTGATEFVLGSGSGDTLCASLNNAGTLAGSVEVASDASLTNEGSISGEVSVSGTLLNEGRIGGCTTVQSGGTLRGSGSVASLSLQDGANFIGSLSAPMTAESLTLGGTVSVSATPDASLGTAAFSCVLLQAASTEGTGSFVWQDSAEWENAELVWDAESGTLTLNAQQAESALQSLVGAAAAPQAPRVAPAQAALRWMNSQWVQDAALTALRHGRSYTVGTTTAWLSACGASSRLGGFRFSGTGAMVGVEHAVAEGAALGLMLGQQWGQLSGNGTDADSDGTLFGTYAAARRGRLFGQAYAAYARADNKGISRGTSVSGNTDSYAAGLRAGYELLRETDCSLSLYSGVDYSAAAGQGRLQRWQLPVGLQASTSIGRLTPYASLAWLGELDRRESGDAVPAGRHAVEFSFGADYKLSESWTLSPVFTVESRRHADTARADIQLRYSF